MKGKLTVTFWMIWGAMLFLVFSIKTAEAQDVPQTEERQFEGELTDNDIQSILNEQGIPFDPYSDSLSSTYTLGIDDVIEISVLRHPELSGQYLINREGNIQYEFVGDISISGLTKKELTEILSEK